MANTKLEEIAARVEREREAHEVDDVLAESWKLKHKFSHSLNNPAHNALQDNYHSFLAQADQMDVLDYGCGRGEYALDAARSGARVVGIDISANYVDWATEVAARENLKGSAVFQVMDAHNLKFADNSFDMVIGNGILHHLDVARAWSEIRRVLRPGGRAVFQEPLADNPLLKLFRIMTPQARTIDEAPFTRRDLRRMSTGWVVESEYFGILSAPISIATSLLIPKWPNNPISTLAYGAERVLNRLRVAESWNQYVLIKYKKPIEL